MEKKVEDLPVSGKLELSRRVNVARAVIGAIRGMSSELVANDEEITEYRKSKFKQWALFLTIGFSVLGKYVATFFYLFAFLAVIFLIERYSEQSSAEKARQAFVRRLEELRTLWVSVGLYLDHFESLVFLLKHNIDHGDDVFTKWWCVMEENAEDDVRTIFGLEHTSGARERSATFDEEMARLRQQLATHTTEELSKSAMGEGAAPDSEATINEEMARLRQQLAIHTTEELSKSAIGEGPAPDSEATIIEQMRSWNKSPFDLAAAFQRNPWATALLIVLFCVWIVNLFRA